jgi:hypothetical protein
MTGLQPLILIAPIALVLFAGAVAYRFFKSNRSQDQSR